MSSSEAVAAKANALSSRERILAAAKHLFARNGYENTSTVAIARDAGTSESQLMKHFGSKLGLLSAILDRGWDGIIARSRSSNGETSSELRLYGMLEAIVVELENDTEMKEVMTLEAQRVRKENRDVLTTQGYRQFGELLESQLGEMRAQKQIRADLNLAAIRAALMGTVESLLREQVVAQRSELHDGYNVEHVRQMLEVLVAALAAQPA